MHFEKQKQFYLKLLTEHPNDVEALHALAILAAKTNDLTKALDYLQQALKLEPNSPSLYNSLGNALARLNKNDEAITNYQQALHLDLTYAAAYVGLGNVYLRMANLYEAENYYQTALKIKPNYLEPHYNLALIKIKQGKIRSAIQHLQKILEIDASHTAALHQLAQLFHQQGNQEKAIENYTKFLALEPSNQEALTNLANLYLQQKKYQAALKYFLRLLAYQQKPEIYFNIGIIYMEQEQHREAEQYFNEAIRCDPSYLPAYVNLGAVYLKLGNHPQAISCYRRLLELQPHNQEYAYVLQALDPNQSKQFEQAPSEYLQHLFDQYAPYFDQHLNILEYQVPELIAEVLAKIDSPDVQHSAIPASSSIIPAPAYARINSAGIHDLTIIELGCGTGLVGAKLRTYAKTLIGIDISENMLEVAKSKNLYDELYVGDMVEKIKSFKDLDLIVIADALGYLGNLEPLIHNCQQALKLQGWLIFTVEKSVQYPYVLQKSARFAHHQKYINELAQKYNFQIVSCTNIILRKEHGIPIEGYLYVFQVCHSRRKRESSTRT